MWVSGCLTQVPIPCSDPELRGWPAPLTSMTTLGLEERKRPLQAQITQYLRLLDFPLIYGGMSILGLPHQDEADLFSTKQN